MAGGNSTRPSCSVAWARPEGGRHVDCRSCLPARPDRGRTPVKVDHFLTLTFTLELALTVAGAIAGAHAWTPRQAGELAGSAIGFGVAYILVNILRRLYVIYSDPDRLDRELDEAEEREREERRRRK